MVLRLAVLLGDADVRWLVEPAVTSAESLIHGGGLEVGGLVCAYGPEVAGFLLKYGGWFAVLSWLAPLDGVTLATCCGPVPLDGR